MKIRIVTVTVQDNSLLRKIYLIFILYLLANVNLRKEKRKLSFTYIFIVPTQ